MSKAIEFEIMIFKGNTNARYKPLPNSHFKVADNVKKQIKLRGQGIKFIIYENVLECI